MGIVGRMVWLGMLAGATAAQAQAPVERDGGTIDLPTSKQILGIVPGGPQRLSSLPVSMAVSPDKRYVVTVNAGYGSIDSQYYQALAVLDTTTGKVQEFPDTRTLTEAKQTLFSGLAFSADGRHLYASMASITDPEGKTQGATGSGIAAYTFVQGKLAPEKIMPIPMQKLAAGKTTKLGKGDGTLGVPYPAAIAMVPSACARKHPCEDHNFELMLIADNLSDDVVEMDAWTGRITARFDLSDSPNVPSAYPIGLAVSKDGRHGYVALWNSSEVVELDLIKATVGRRLPLLKPSTPTAPGSHPIALELAPDGKTLYTALSNRDAVAAIDLDQDRFALKGYFDARLPGQSFFGAEPQALALSADGNTLYAANMGSNAVAVWDTRKLTRRAVQKGLVEPNGFIPTEWLPMALASSAGKLYSATGKGTGTGPNNQPQPRTPQTHDQSKMVRDFTYIPTLLHGSLAVVDQAKAAQGLRESTAVALASNRMKAAEEKIVFAGGRPNPIKHVIYIIRENRTYDQILGDLQQDGKPVGNGDPALTMYGREITPNMHKLVLQFGLLDNFYDSAEVSGDGHVWSNTAIGTDYLERTWQVDYRGRERTYDYEGVVSEGIPFLQGIPDVNEPTSGYLWGNLSRHGQTLYHFGEYISSVFCTDKKGGGRQETSSEGPMHEGKVCARSEVKPGETLPAIWGGGINKWPWAIPLLASNTATKPELEGHFAPEAPDFNLKVPDQIRADIFLKHLDTWLADRKAGHDTMPNFIMLRLANDHTAGTSAGSPTPRASIADNDLAVGRAIDAISHSPYWDDTAFFILEDDAQNGADHVDAHRSLGVVVSKYAPRPASGNAFIDSRFYSTVSMIRTMETLLGLPAMNNNDAFSSMISSLFTGPGDQEPFAADYSNRDNNLIYTANARTAPGAKASAKMDFTHADRADGQKLNVILWQDAMGSRALPGMLLERRKKAKDDDD